MSPAAAGIAGRVSGAPLVVGTVGCAGWVVVAVVGVATVVVEVGASVVVDVDGASVVVVADEVDDVVVSGARRSWGRPDSPPAAVPEPITTKSAATNASAGRSPRRIRCGVLGTERRSASTEPWCAGLLSGAFPVIECLRTSPANRGWPRRYQPP